MESTIATSRLLLQPMNENDIDFIVMLEEQAESYQYDSDFAPTYDEISKRCNWFIERAQALPNEGAIRWIMKKDNIPIGEVHFTCNWVKTHEWEIGYKLLKEYWGAGFASEAVRAVIHHAFMNFNVNRIAAFLNSENNRSAALCERIGMLKEGCLREVKLVKGIYYDEYIFSILKREFDRSL